MAIIKLKVNRKTQKTQALQKKCDILLKCNTLIQAKKLFPNVKEYHLHEAYQAAAAENLNKIKEHYAKTIKNSTLVDISSELDLNYRQFRDTYYANYLKLLFELNSKAC